jgi:hypothetical protein
VSDLANSSLSGACDVGLANFAGSSTCAPNMPAETGQWQDDSR